MKCIILNGNNIDINSEDTVIIESFRRGNEKAFNYIVLKYQKKIYWLIRKMVIDHDEADDLTQEVFIKLYDSINSFRGDSKFYTYIYKMAMNHSLNHLKKRHIMFSKKGDFSKEIYNLKSDEKNSDEIYDNYKKTKNLEEAVLLLPDKQRAVFNLRYYENLTYEEISNILNKSIGGLKANYFHAIKKIEEHLKKKRIFNE
ncbi:MAG TPA: sigma-70 family RNA polymerase sigma factor [Ignavibacteria bacterium]